MAIAVNVDGRLCGEHDAVVRYRPRVLFGEGVYEVMRTYGGEPVPVDRHVERGGFADWIALQVRLRRWQLWSGRAARCGGQAGR